MKRAPNPPYDKWLKVEGSPVKKVRFRKSGNVDVVIVPRSRNISHRKSKKEFKAARAALGVQAGLSPKVAKKEARSARYRGDKRKYGPDAKKRGQPLFPAYGKSNPLRYGAHQLPSKEWEIRDHATGRVVQTVKTKSAAIQAVTKWNSRAGTSGAWQMRPNSLTPKQEELYRKAEKIDDRFQKALEKRYGSRAGDWRYRYDLPPHLKRLGKAMQLAMDRYHEAVRTGK